jgi:hypothetical protein
MPLPGSLILLHILVNYFKASNILLTIAGALQFRRTKSFLGTRDRRENR